MPLTSGSRVINGRTDRKRRAQAGIILLDVVLTLAIFGLIALLVLPTLPRGTTPSRQGAYAAQIAALMKNDRMAAARQRREIATRVDVANRVVSSGSSTATVTLPSDVRLDVVASQLCADQAGGFAIRFAPDGRSCGAIVHVAKGELDWRIRINWLTGLIDIVAPGRG
jgi:general secretion pathway protein H